MSKKGFFSLQNYMASIQSVSNPLEHSNFTDFNFDTGNDTMLKLWQDTAENEKKENIEMPKKHRRKEKKRLHADQW